MQTYQELLSSARLARYVECYWSREDPQGTRGHSVLPDGCVDILFSARSRQPVELTIVGLMTTRKDFDIPAGDCLFGVRFRPGMAAAFIPETACLTDKVEPLENVIGKPGQRLFEQLAECANPVEMTRIMESFLRPLEPPDATQKALEHLRLLELSVDHLASAAGMSVRHLRRMCLARAGVTPKYLSRILRFRRAAERIGGISSGTVQPNWAQLAADCGYFDQAHFIREFLEFTGDTPGRYLQSVWHRSS